MLCRTVQVRDEEKGKEQWVKKQKGVKRKVKIMR